MITYDIPNKYVRRGAVPLPMRRATKYIVVHHAAYEYRPGMACHSIFNYHSSKWPGYGRIGYQVVLQLEATGTINRYNVNPLDCVGANVALRNHEVIGVCCATNFMGIPSAEWFTALVVTIRDLMQRYPNAAVVGHKDIAKEGYATACPGVAWHEWKSALLSAL